MKNKNIFIVSFLIFSMILASCTKQVTTETQTTWEVQTNVETTTTSWDTQTTTSWSKEIELKLTNNSTEKITLNWSSISYSWNNASVDWNKITINKAGNYEISWTLTDWQIIVDTTDNDAVQLILNWVTITNSTSSTIYVKNGKQTIITLADWSTNTLTDWEKYTFEDEEDEPNATVFSKDDLIIMWNWTLKVDANYNDWIASKDTLVIKSWNIEVDSVDDWIRWKDLLQIDGWNIKVTSAWDSLKADNETEWQVFINGWNIEINSWDDAVHAEVSLTVNWWTINVKKSYEWLEAQIITINGWNIDIVSSDDWINVAWWNDSSGMWWPGWWWDFWWMNTSDNSSYYIYFNGWVVNVNASWDGLDANWSIIMTGWEVYVNWPTSNWNWPLDYDGKLEISGWTLIAAWSSWMAQNVSTTSTQNWVLIWFDSSVSTGTKFELKDSSWNMVASFTPSKTYQSIVVSNSSLKTWETYTYYVWWEEKWNFTISSVATKVWTISSWMWWGRWQMSGSWQTMWTPPGWFGSWWERPTPPEWFDWWTPPDMNQ